ncbi:hypothetical protein AB7828_03550 [Tardiphaga sp. 215_C5_N2_1]|uniref:hypothetical protein n=1 Tax=Tardiphaga sp. 215_C5_N2_1 TaxID=3240774 RepID=UPI003F89447D
MSALSVCSSCPHASGCSRVSKCLYELAAEDYDKKYNSPRFMTPGQANNVIRKMRGGMTLKHLHQADESGLAIVSASKLRKHCATYPEYGAEVDRLAEINRRKADENKGSKRRNSTHCKHGHPLSGNNVGVHIVGKCRGRYCKTCQKRRGATGGIMRADVLLKVKDLLSRGVPITQIQSKALGSKYYAVPSAILATYRRANPEFNLFVLDSIKGSNCRGQQFRHQRIRSARAREEANDYYRIQALVPMHLPDYVRDDITQNVMTALLEGSLLRSDVRSRIGRFVADHQRMFPTKYAKFGNATLVSLDEVMFDTSSTTRGDTISEGLWS